MGRTAVMVLQRPALYIKLLEQVPHESVGLKPTAEAAGEPPFTQPGLLLEEQPAAERKPEPPTTAPLQPPDPRRSTVHKGDSPQLQPVPAAEATVGTLVAVQSETLPSTVPEAPPSAAALALDLEKVAKAQASEVKAAGPGAEEASATFPSEEPSTSLAPIQVTKKATKGKKEPPGLDAVKKPKKKKKVVAVTEVGPVAAQALRREPDDAAPPESISDAISATPGLLQDDHDDTLAVVETATAAAPLLDESSGNTAAGADVESDAPAAPEDDALLKVIIVPPAKEPITASQASLADAEGSVVAMPGSVEEESAGVVRADNDRTEEPGVSTPVDLKPGETPLAPTLVFDVCALPEPLAPVQVEAEPQQRTALLAVHLGHAEGEVKRMPFAATGCLPLFVARRPQTRAATGIRPRQ
jgi:hypothetical protein